jgi:hypothetical protein
MNHFSINFIFFSSFFHPLITRLPLRTFHEPCLPPFYSVVSSFFCLPCFNPNRLYAVLLVVVHLLLFTFSLGFVFLACLLGGITLSTNKTRYKAT